MRKLPKIFLTRFENVAPDTIFSSLPVLVSASRSMAMSIFSVSFRVPRHRKFRLWGDVRTSR